MNWTKRTKQQIDQAVDNKDYTGGYEFFPWIWHMRKFLVVAFFLNIFLGFKCFQAYPEYGYETPTLIAAIFFGIGVPAIIAGLLIREFREKKKGISR
jgi:hypothetical protein